VPCRLRRLMPPPPLAPTCSACTALCGSTPGAPRVRQAAAGAEPARQIVTSQPCMQALGGHTHPHQTIDALSPAGGRQAQDPALPARSDVVVAGEDSMLWALLCLANHSCSPNAHIVFAGPGPTALLRASRDLPAGKFHELDSAGCLQAAAALAAFRG
jgi:hypothetical protein